MKARLSVGLGVFAALSLLYCAVPQDDASSDESAVSKLHDGYSLYRTGNRLKSPGPDKFLDEVQPIFAEKCVGCHSCGESPCELKLNSFQGIARGMSGTDPYGLHIASIPWTANEDQFTPADWQTRSFSSVTTGAAASLMAKALSQGKEKNFLGFDDRFAYAEPKKECPRTAMAMDKHLVAHPEQGMPYGLPRLEPEEYKILEAWLAAGAPGPSPEIQAKLEIPENQAVVDRWEAFFNTGDGTYGPQVDIVARFIYEHSWLADLNFKESPNEFYKLVRSKTPVGQPLDEIFTEVPYDPPGIASRVYYRLKKVTKIIGRKNHIVWDLSDQRLDFYKDLFYRREHWWASNTRVPNYDDWNPFANFEAIPTKIRYQWILDNTELLIDSMTRGPVCIGSMATYVVADHFWGWWLDPDMDPAVADPTLGTGNYDALKLKDQAHTLQYLQAWEDTLRKTLAAKGKTGLTVDDLWDGKKGSAYPSPTMWTTQVRHQTNMTVHTGPAGGMPQSIWVSSFSHIERLYYDLVASFRAYGSAGHKLETWNYMSYIRTEGEDLFISLLPESQRQAVRDQYTAGWIGNIKRYDDYGAVSQLWKDAMVQAGYLSTNMLAEGRPAGTDEPLSVSILANKMRARAIVAPGKSTSDPLNNFPAIETGFTVPASISSATELEQGLRTITATTHWGAPRFFPSVTYVRFGTGDDALFYTLVTNRQYDSHNEKFAESLTRSPAQDTISAYRGILGNYPNAFLDIPFADAPAAIRAMQAIDSDSKMNEFRLRYQVGRNSKNFWPFVQWINHWQEKNDQVDGGIVDLSKYELDGQ